jgi:L-lactate dehydrogenase complex protein LldF
MLIGLRELQHHRKPSRLESLAYFMWKVALKQPSSYRIGLKATKWLLRRRATDGWISHLPGEGHGWTDVRDFPAPAAKSFRERWREI